MMISEEEEIYTKIRRSNEEEKTCVKYNLQ